MKIFDNATVAPQHGLINLKMMVHSDDAEEYTTIHNAGGMIEKYGVCELVQAATVGKPCFATKTVQKCLNYVKEISIPNQKLRVLPLEKVPWNLATELQSYEDLETLWNDVKQCIIDHVDLPEPEAYNALVAWVFASWQLEKWQIAPYLFFFGTFGTGKTRALEVLSKLCSRGWLALYVTTASLYRPIESWKPTIFLDEAEIYGDKHEVIGLLNGSYRKGQYVCRQKENADEGGYETEFFDCFSFKAIAGTKELAKTLQSRCIIFRTSHATRKIKFFVDEKRCLELRNKMLMWRFKTVLTEDTEGSEDESKRLEDLVQEIGNQREVELFYPLISVAPNNQIKQELISYAKASASRKLEELSLTTEATCLSAILTAKQNGLLKNGHLLIQDITTTANENLSFEEHWKERFTSSLCARLGFQKSRGAGGKAVILWSEPLIERLRKDQRYALCFSQVPSVNEFLRHCAGLPSESSEPSVSSSTQKPETFPQNA